MSALTAAQIEQAIVALKPGAADQEIDFLLSVAIVLDNIAVGFEIERVEQRTPPFGRQVAFEIGYRPQGTQAGPFLAPRRRRRIARRSRVAYQGEAGGDP